MAKLPGPRPGVHVSDPVKRAVIAGCAESSKNELAH